LVKPKLEISAYLTIHLNDAFFPSFHSIKAQLALVYGLELLFILGACCSLVFMATQS